MIISNINIEQDMVNKINNFFYVENAIAIIVAIIIFWIFIYYSNGNKN